MGAFIVGGMGILTSLFEKRELTVMPTAMRSAITSSGVAVTPDTALRSSAVFACVRVLAESVAQLPLQLFERVGQDKRPAKTHPLYRVLHDAPNPEMTSFELREVLMMHLCLRGNGYCEIVWGEDGHVQALWPLHPDRVHVIRGNDNRLYYDVTVGWAGGHERYRETVRLAEYQILHLRGLGQDGVLGLSPIRLFAQAIGLGMAAEGFGARFFGNDARPGGILRHPQTLSDPAHQRLRSSWNSRHQGLDKSHNVAILEEGMEYQQIGIRPDEAQFLETRKFQITDIARIFRVPPHMIADLDRATFSNIEHLSIEFVVHSLGPWLTRWEQALARALLIGGERERYFVDHDVTHLLRGDVQSRFSAYATARQWGWMSVNDIRRTENLNSVENGDVYLSPLNMVPVEQLVNSEGGNGNANDANDANLREQRGFELRALDRARGVRWEQRAAGEARRKLYGVYRPMIARALGKVLRAERDGLKGIVKEPSPPNPLSQRVEGEKRNAELDLALDIFYAGFSADFLRLMLPVMMTYLEAVVEAVGDEGFEYGDDLSAWVKAYVEAWVRRPIGKSRAAIDRADDVEETVREMPKRASSDAADEAVRFNNGVATTIYAAMGVRELIWLAFGDSCPFCRDLNGKRVGIESYFLTAGVEFSPDGVTVGLTPSTNVRHAPAHRGCDCGVVAG